MFYSLYRRTWIKISAIILLGFVAYSFMLSAPFKTMDDNISIVNNREIRSFSNIPAIFQKGFFSDRSYYRPMVMLSFMMEYHFIELNPLFYNLTNAFLHLLTAVMIFFLMRRLMDDDNIAFFSALLFSIHPIHWEAVSNIAGRSIVLCTFFLTVSFYGYLLFSGFQKGRLFYVGSLAFFGLAMFSKEAAASFPLVVAGYEILCSPVSRGRVRRAAMRVLPFFLIFGAYSFIRLQLSMTEIFRWNSFHDLVMGIITFLRASLTTLRICFFPWDLHFDRGRAAFENFANIELWITLCVYLAAVAAIVKMRAKMRPQVLFLFAWVVTMSLPVCQIIPISIQPGYLATADHFFYPASIGVFTLFSFFFRWIYVKGVALEFFSKTIFLGCVAGFFLYLMIMLINQNIYSSRELMMCHQAVKYAPWNARMQVSLGLTYARKWYFPEAEQCFRKALSFDPLNPIARISLGASLHDQGKILEALEEYQKVMSDDPRMHQLLLKNVQTSARVLIDRYKKNLMTEPENDRLHYSLGVAYAVMGRIEEAIKAYELAVGLNPAFKEALFNMAVCYEALGNREAAAVYYEKVAALPDSKNYFVDSNARFQLETLGKTKAESDSR